MKKCFTAILITLFLFFAVSAAHAALVTENFTGTITFAADANPFGVSDNDIFTWSATYDLEYLDFGYLTIGNSPDMHLSVTIGSRTFVETEDVLYSSPFGAVGPILTFDDANTITGMSFVVIDEASSYAFRNQNQNFAGFNIFNKVGDADGELLVSGTFNFNPVPVPAAVWLLGSGLVGLAGLRRRTA